VKAWLDHDLGTEVRDHRHQGRPLHHLPENRGQHFVPLHDLHERHGANHGLGKFARIEVVVELLRVPESREIVHHALHLPQRARKAVLQEIARQQRVGFREHGTVRGRHGHGHAAQHRMERLGPAVHLDRPGDGRQHSTIGPLPRIVRLLARVHLRFRLFYGHVQQPSLRTLATPQPQAKQHCVATPPHGIARTIPKPTQQLLRARKLGGRQPRLLHVERQRGRRGHTAGGAA
jgi:hypothetical protein